MKRSRAPSQVKSAKAAKTTTQARYKNFSIPRQVPRTSLGFPKQLRMKHRYVQHFQLSSPLGVLFTQKFRCNGMFDPDVTGTGHQPMYYDQLTALYNHWTVLKSKISVRFCSESTGAAVGTTCAIYIDDDSSSTPSTIDGICEQNSAVYSLLTPLGNDTIKLSKKWDAIEAFGPSPLANDNLQGTISSDPTEQQVYVVAIDPIGTNANYSVGAIVTIEYDVVWDELVNNAGS